jgi:hypothetical protein
MSTDESDTIVRLFLAALRCAGETLRDVPRAEPELGDPGALQDAAWTYGVPDRSLAQVQRIANALRFFADSVRIAEHNNKPILRMMRERTTPWR